MKKDGFAEFLFGVAENPESIRELVPIGKNILKAISTALTEIRPELNELLDEFCKLEQEAVERLQRHGFSRDEAIDILTLTMRRLNRKS